MVDTLHSCFPQAKIDFLVNKRVSELVFGYPNINKVHTIEKESEIGKICKENEYDLAIIVSPKFEIARQVYRSGVKYRLGTRNRWYSFMFNIRHAQHRRHALKNEMEYNLDLLSEINCNYSKELMPVLKVKEEHHETIKGRLKDLGINKDFIVIHIPSLGSAKVWSDENFIKLIDSINGKILIILTGAPDEKPRILKVINSLNNSENVIPVTDLSLNELAALLKLSKLFIGNSTGPIHLAAAVGTFVVGLYSPVKVESPVRWGPVTEKKKIFAPVKNDDSRDVMDDIKPEEVAEFVLGYIALNNTYF
jgi:heptosyltransferase III